MAKNWYSILVRENVYGIASQTLAICAGIAFAVIFPRVLGPGLFSYFSLVFAFANVMLFFCKFGSYEALIKLLPASIVTGAASSTYRYLLRIRYLLSLASSVFMFAFSDSLASILFRDASLSFGIRVGAVFLFSYSLYEFYETVFVAVKRNKFALYVNVVFQSSRIALPLVLYYVYRTYTSVLLGVGLAALAGLFAGVLLERGIKVVREGDGMVDKKTFRKYFTYGSVGYFGLLLLQWMDTLLVGVLVDPAEVGFYRVGVMWMSVVWLFIPFSSRVLFALYSEKTETLEREKINTVYSYSLRYSLLVAFLIMAGVWLTSDYFIAFVYGPEYAAAAPVLLVLSFLAVESSLNAINTPLLQGVGKIDVQTKYMITVGLLAFLGGIYGSGYGIVGVAFAFMLVRTVSMIALTAYVLRVLKAAIRPGVYLKPLFSAVLTFVLLSPLKHLVSSLPTGLLYGFSVVAVYVSIAVALKTVSFKELKKIASALADMLG